MKKKKSVGRILSILLLVALLTWIMTSAGNFYAFKDLPSLLFVSLLSIALLVFTNQWSDYIRAIKISMGKTEFTTKEYKASYNAMDLSIKTVFISGVIGSIVGMIQLTVLLSDIQNFTLGMAIGILTFLYALIINMVQYAIKSMIAKEIIYRENDDN